MQIERNRPLSSEGREEKELRVYDLLDSLGIAYDRVDHEPAMTMEVCREIDLVLGASMCKNLFLTNRQETAFYLLLMPGDKKFMTKVLSEQLATARLSFGSPEAMERLLGTTPGSATVMGLMSDRSGEVQLVIDEEILEAEYIGVHPMVNTSSIRLRVSDLTERVLPALHHIPIKVRL